MTNDDNDRAFHELASAHEEIDRLRAENERLAEALVSLKTYCDHRDDCCLKEPVAGKHPEDVFCSCGLEDILVYQIPSKQQRTRLRELLGPVERLLQDAKCPECDGSGGVSVPIGEHFVSREMALDAFCPEMEGSSSGIEYEHRACQWCHERNEQLTCLRAVMQRTKAAGRPSTQLETPGSA